MEILNKNGETLLEYRKEFKRHYADTIDDSLKRGIFNLYQEKKISEKLFRIILNEDIDDLEVYTYLISQKEYTKSAAELNYEFDKTRQKVNDYLISCGFINNVSTKNCLNDNKICIIRQYDVNKELLLSFFGLTPTEIIPLMKRKGFMDKFCVLRLNQIFKEIYGELKIPEHIDHGYSLVYYNKLIQGFSIDYKYYVNINYLSDENNMINILDKIKELDKVVEKKFQNKLNYAYYSKLSKTTSKITDKNNFISPESNIKIAPVLLTEPEIKKDNKNIKAPILIIDEEKAKTNINTENSASMEEKPKKNKPEKNKKNKNQNNVENNSSENSNTTSVEEKSKIENSIQNNLDNKNNKQKQNNNNSDNNNENNENKQNNKKEKSNTENIESIQIDIPEIEIDEDDKDLL